MEHLLDAEPTISMSQRETFTEPPAIKEDAELDPLEGEYTKAAPEKTFRAGSHGNKWEETQDNSSSKRSQGRVMTAPSPKDAEEQT